MQTHIDAELDRIATAEDVEVLYAVESGSRAWGFPSEGSDWDVRFIYIHPPDWYLSIRQGRDVFESRVGELDLVGWDLKKALLLLAKSNPTLFEWLQAPIVYRECAPVVSVLRRLSVEHFSPRASGFHYFRTARGDYGSYLAGAEVRLKKYFYVLRPVLACRWIEAHGTLPPVAFSALVADQLPPGLHPALDALLERKRRGDERATGPRIQDLHHFLDAEINRLERVVSSALPQDGPELAVLDGIFRATLEEVWG